MPARVSSAVPIGQDVPVPCKPDDVNQEGREVPADLPRVDFLSLGTCRSAANGKLHR